MAQLLSTADLGPSRAYDGWVSFWQQQCFEWQSRRTLKASPFSGAIDYGKLGRREMLVIQQSDHQVSKICTGRGVGEPSYLVMHQLAGECSIKQGKVHGEMHVGDVTIVDTELPVHFDYRGGCTQIHFVLPKVALWSPGERRSIETGRVIPAQGLGHFIGMYLQCCFSSSQTTASFSDPESNAMVQALVELLRAAPASTISASAMAVRSHLVLLQQWIDSHLGDPNLTPQRIAERYGISVRHLHRLFEPLGQTVTQWIEQRRLCRCYEELADARHAAATITDIAFRWGFADASHFSRAFRRHYQTSPRDHRRSTAPRHQGPLQSEQRQLHPTRVAEGARSGLLLSSLRSA